jgi:hypothetical protein
MYPGIPALLVCVDDSKFNAFKVGLFKYIDQFDSEQFVKQICNRNLTGNPFAFAWSTDRTYAKLYLKVFRKAVVQMRAEDYNDLLTRGLLDPHHTIGLFAIYLIRLNADMGLLQGNHMVGHPSLLSFRPHKKKSVCLFGIAKCHSMHTQ